MVPPDTPGERRAALQTAFTAMLNDPAFKADAEKQHVDVDPISAERIETVLRQSFSARQETIDRLIEASKPPE
jgi:tripartite-type tricarboxylate transporter receptor subunit TctC